MLANDSKKDETFRWNLISFSYLLFIFMKGQTTRMFVEKAKFRKSHTETSQVWKDKKVVKTYDLVVNPPKA